MSRECQYYVGSSQWRYCNSEMCRKCRLKGQEITPFSSSHEYFIAFVFMSSYLYIQIECYHARLCNRLFSVSRIIWIILQKLDMTLLINTAKRIPKTLNSSIQATCPQNLEKKTNMKRSDKSSYCVH